MLPSEKLGLSGPYAWILDQNWFGSGVVAQFAAYVAICWLITPVGHLVWGVISQFQFLPIWRGQWRSFFPGDLFLGLGVAGFMTYAVSMPEQQDRWFQATWWQVVVVSVAIIMAIVLTLVMDRPAMELTALLSPSKIFHNGLLYVGYGSLAALCAIGGVAGHWGEPTVWWVLAPFVPFGLWVSTVVIDGRKPLEEQQRIQRTAHPASYWLFGLVWIQPRQ